MLTLLRLFIGVVIDEIQIFNMNSDLIGCKYLLTAV